MWFDWSVFFELIVKVFPLYILVAMGYVAGKFLKIQGSEFGRMLFYMFNPLVMLHGILHAGFSPALLTVPIVVCIVGSIASLCVYYSTSFIQFKDRMRNIVAFSTGTSSMGYFGIPVAMLVFGGEERTMGIYVIACIGMMLFESTCGFYLVVRDQCTARDCIKKVLSLPALYAAILGFILSWGGMKSPVFFDHLMHNLRAAYSVMGMMVIGLGLSLIKEFYIDWKVLTVTLMTKYILWPVMIFSLIFVDKTFINFYNEDIYRSLIILAIVPISVSNVIMATVFNYSADKVAIVVLINTLIALLYVPIMISIFL